MSNETYVTIVGNATADAEMRFTPQGVAVANFTVAHSDRVKNGADQWEDGPTVFYRVTAWRKLAEGVAEAIHKGQRVVVVGTLKPREYEGKNGKGLSLDVTADEVGTSVLFAGSQRQQGAPQTSAGWSGPTSQNRWSGQGGPITGGVDPWAAQQSEEAPF